MTDDSGPATLEDQAIAWSVRVGDPAFDAWDDFERWLAAGPAHAAAYHAAAAAAADMVELLAAAAHPVRVPSAVPPPAELRRPRARRAWVGGAIAATLVAAIGVAAIGVATNGFRPFDASPPTMLAYETAPGERRAIRLADGSAVMLNGGTRLLVAEGSRSARLERGEGLFTVRHDPAHPFRVDVGSAAVIDVGTVFDIVREAKATRVAVAEGAVDWRVAERGVRVGAGRALHAEDGSGEIALGDATAAAIGGWSRGELAFDGAPLATAAADLSRTLGVAIAVDPAIAARPVRGTIRLDGGAAMVVPRFAALLGLAPMRSGQSWRLTPAS